MAKKKKPTKHKSMPKKSTKKKSTRLPKTKRPKTKVSPRVARLAPAAAPDADADKVEVVVQMSNNGPYLVSQIAVNDQDVLDEAIQTTEPQTRIDITEQFSPGARIAWRVVGAVQFPKAGVFLHQPAVEPDQPLGTRAPLRKGVAWIGEKVAE